jgi:hypothetical protein
MSVLTRSEVCNLLAIDEVETAFGVKFDRTKTTYERAIFSNGRFSGCTYFVENIEDRPTDFNSGRISWKVQSWPFEVARMTDPAMNRNGEFPQAVAQTIGALPAALQDFSENTNDSSDGAYRGMLLTIDFDTFSVSLSSDQFVGHNNRKALFALSELVVKRLAVLNPSGPSRLDAATTATTSAYDRSDQQLCALIRDASVLRWNPDAKIGTSGRLECDIDLRVGVDSGIRTTKNDAEFQVGRRVGYQEVAGEIFAMSKRKGHLVVGGNPSFPELVAWGELSDDQSVMFRVFGLKDTPENRRSVIDEFAHIVLELDVL